MFNVNQGKMAKAAASPDTGVRRVQGRVKWFDSVRGFGFVLADNGGDDILLHANVLRNFGQSSVADAAIVDLDDEVWNIFARGRAVEVRHLEAQLLVLHV